MRQHHSVPQAESAFIIRLGTTSDAPMIAWHRARMWQDMGDVPPDLFEPLRAKSEGSLKGMIDSKEYVAWLAALRRSPETIIAGAGVHLRDAMPFPFKISGKTVRVAKGRLGAIVNVFTEPEWRRRGIAALLMQRIIGWLREQGIERLTLHASDAGRALYEKVGFIATNEMRLAND